MSGPKPNLESLSYLAFPTAYPPALPASLLPLQPHSLGLHGTGRAHRSKSIFRDGLRRIYLNHTHTQMQVRVAIMISEADLRGLYII